MPKDQPSAVAFTETVTVRFGRKAPGNCKFLDHNAVIPANLTPKGLNLNNPRFATGGSECPKTNLQR